ncbi:MAG: Do family serine endopeptidase [Desulfobacterales bacterium]
MKSDPRATLPALRLLLWLPALLIGLVTAVLMTGRLAEARPAVETGFVVPRSFSELAAQVSPSVVNIRTVKVSKDGGRVFRHFFRGPQTPGDPDDPFQDFFDKFFEQDKQREFRQRSLGSGFIIDKSGFVVTNNHVVEDADEIRVILKNGKEFDAAIVGRDPNTDLALIKIKSDQALPILELGSSAGLEVGQWVMAIGSPFGLEHTVTAGIVSAKGRVIGSGPYDDFIQTDASINPGNSGGPLINLQGEVVGINTAIIAGGQGIGFAIPIDLARGVIEQLKQAGEVTRGWLGVAIQNLSEELAEYYGVGDRKGVLVTEVFPGDPADKGGIRAGDIILAVKDQPVATSRDLTRLIADLSVGQTVGVKILREGREKSLRVKIARREEGKLAARENGAPQEGGGADELGIRVGEITPEIAHQLNLENPQGVVVMGVESDSRGEAAGVRMGDIIKEINHQTVGTLADYNRVIAKSATGQTLQFFIMRPASGFVVIKITR